MTEEQKQALIEWLKEGIELREEYGFNGNLLASMRVALGALTAQPIKLPTGYTSAYASPGCDERFMRKSEVMAAIRAAGYEVQE